MHPVGADRPTSGLALAAMVLGILGIATSCVGIGAVLGLIALILGIVAVNQIGGDGNVQKGKGMAITGIVTGALTFLIVPILALLIGILLPALGAARRTARQMQNNTQLRGVHQSMVMFAQNNGHNFPGIDPSGNIVDPTVEGRFQTLLDGNYFTGDYLVSPSEVKTAWQPGMTLTPANYSYALLAITDGIDRQREWSQTLNPEAVTVSDRNAGTPTDAYSVHTKPGGGWRGGVAYNDNHVVFESTHILSTQYGAGAFNAADNLFQAAGPSDADMIHSGR